MSQSWVVVNKDCRPAKPKIYRKSLLTPDLNSLVSRCVFRLNMFWILRYGCRLFYLQSGAIKNTSTYLKDKHLIPLTLHKRLFNPFRFMKTSLHSISPHLKLDWAVPAPSPLAPHFQWQATQLCRGSSWQGAHNSARQSILLPCYGECSQTELNLDPCYFHTMVLVSAFCSYSE